MENFLTQLPQQVVNGLTLGAVYALIALGYSMVYGVLQLLNFAHGDVYMIGSFVGFFVLEALVPPEFSLGVSVIVISLMMLAAMLFCGVLGVAIEQFAYRPLRNAPRIAPLISALGVSFFLQAATQLVLGANFRQYQSFDVIPLQSAVEFGDVRIGASRILVIVVAIVLMVLLTILVRYTRIGAAMRAVATDREAAEMMGVDVDRVILITFFIGSALAGAAGVLNGLVFRRVWHLMGFTAGLKGFAAAVVGGIGNIPGAMLGGFLIGMVESFSAGYLSSTFDEAFVFIALVLVLLVRPSGLLGAKNVDKV